MGDLVIGTEDLIVMEISSAVLTKLGLAVSDPEAGIHAHGLDRGSNRTLTDGPHLHLFILPDGTWVITKEDGEHDHEITESGDKTKEDGEHDHRVVLEDGTILTTDQGGEHEHDLLVQFSAFDGTHGHVMALPDGTKINSVSAGEFAELVGATGPGSSPGSATHILTGKRALELSLDPRAGRAFGRLSKGLLGLGEALVDTGTRLGQLGDDLISVPLAEIEDPLGVDQAIEDLELVQKQINDPETSARFLQVIDRLKRKHRPQKARGETLSIEFEGDEGSSLLEMLQHIGRTAAIGHSFPVVVDPDDSEFKRTFHFDGDGAFRMKIIQRKADLSTADLATQGGLRLPGQGTLTPRFRIRPAGDLYEVFDTETGRVVAQGLTEEEARANASRRNVALRKALGERVGVFLRVPKTIADQMPSLGEQDQSPRHVTMLMVGELDEQNFEIVVKAIQEVAKALDPFDVDMEDFGEFKNGKGETIAHLIPRAHGDVGLEEIHGLLREEVVKAGIKPTHHPGPFKPHVTLARVAPGEEFTGDCPSGSFRATSLEVWGEHGGEFGRIVIALGSGDIVESLDSTKSGADEEIKELSFKILKSDSGDEDDERVVFGIVLEPETVDTQGDIYSAEEIEKTAFRFMERYQQFGLMHKRIVQSILPLQSYLAPVDFELDGQKIKKGTWLLGVRVLDGQIWKDVKSGKLTGFSIGGSAIRRSEILGDVA